MSNIVNNSKKIIVYVRDIDKDSAALKYAAFMSQSINANIKIFTNIYQDMGNAFLAFADRLSEEQSGKANELLNGAADLMRSALDVSNFKIETEFINGNFEEAILPILRSYSDYVTFVAGDSLLEGGGDSIINIIFKVMSREEYYMPTIIVPNDMTDSQIHRSILDYECNKNDAEGADRE